MARSYTVAMKRPLTAKTGNKAPAPLE